MCNLQSSNQDLKTKIDSLKTINKEVSETAHANQQQIKKLQSQLDAHRATRCETDLQQVAAAAAVSADVEAGHVAERPVVDRKCCKISLILS